jgi:hypothetical protein
VKACFVLATACYSSTAQGSCCGATLGVALRRCWKTCGASTDRLDAWCVATMAALGVAQPARRNAASKACTLVWRWKTCGASTAWRPLGDRLEKTCTLVRRWLSYAAETLEFGCRTVLRERASERASMQGAPMRIHLDAVGGLLLLLWRFNGLLVVLDVWHYDRSFLVLLTPLAPCGAWTPWRRWFIGGGTPNRII